MIKNPKWSIWLLAWALPAYAGTCKSGDCQAGTVTGPFAARQVAENTATNFPICNAKACTTGDWTGQIEGIDAQQFIGTGNQFFDQGKFPVDANIAVGAGVEGGHAQVLEWVNNRYIQAFDKTTGAPVFSSSGTATEGIPANVARLWSTGSQPECAAGTSTNVQVIFDQLDGKFAFGRTVEYTSGGVPHYAYCVATSSRSDLSQSTTNWYAYEYKLDTVLPCVPTSSNCTTGSNYFYYPDFPKIATWSNGFYITFDLEDPTKGYSIRGFEACKLDRSDIVQGAATNPMSCYRYEVPAGNTPSLIHSADVADIDSAAGPPSGEPEYFLAAVNPSNIQGGGNGTGPCTMRAAICTSNQLALFTWGSGGFTGPTFLAVSSYTPGCYDTSAAHTITNTICIPVPSTPAAAVGPYGSKSCGDRSDVPCVDSLGDRLTNRLAYNNLSSPGSGPNGGYLTATHVVLKNKANQGTGIRYYILQVSKGNATVLVNSGTSSGPPDLYDPSDSRFYLMPSAAMDQNGNLGVTYTTSGLHENPAVNIDVLPWTATTLDAPTLIVQGAGDEENSYHWGEYQALQLDSTDSLTFYGVGQYFNTSQTGTIDCYKPASNCYTWQTRVFRGQYGKAF